MQENDLQKLKKLGERVKYLRKNKKLTLSQLCYKHGLEPSTVSRIEKAQVEAKYLTILKIAEAFDLSIKDFLDF